MHLEAFRFAKFNLNFTGGAGGPLLHTHNNSYRLYYKKAYFNEIITKKSKRGRLGTINTG